MQEPLKLLYGRINPSNALFTRVTIVAYVSLTIYGVYPAYCHGYIPSSLSLTHRSTQSQELSND